MVTESVSFLRAAFVQKRTGQIFDIIVEFPDSAPSVHDLGASLSQTGAYSAFMDGARAAFERRLLVPGATTEAILQMSVFLLFAHNIPSPLWFSHEFLYFWLL